MFRKLAMIMRKNDRIFIQKWGEWYLISNGYILVKANEEQYIEFYSKYNSYVSTQNIPMNFEEKVVIQGEKYGNAVLFEYEADFTKVLNDIKDIKVKPVTITDYKKEIKLEKRIERIFKTQGSLGCYDEKFHFLLKENSACFTKTIENENKGKWLNNPLYLFGDMADDPYAVIMPLINSNFNKELKVLVG